jgi:hypothetical protein
MLENFQKSAGAKAREMVFRHQAFNNGRHAILLLGQAREAQDF